MSKRCLVLSSFRGYFICIGSYCVLVCVVCPCNQGDSLDFHLVI
jgi:hypothetical protein